MFKSNDKYNDMDGTCTVPDILSGNQTLNLFSHPIHTVYI